MSSTKETNKKQDTNDENIIFHTVKDRVFSSLFEDKNNLLDLYRTLHPEDKGVTADDLKTVTLETVIVKDIHNDLGFTVRDDVLILAESQSTWSDNIAVRCLMYYATTVKDIAEEEEKGLHETKKLKIPVPEMYVIYVGNRNIAKKEVSLSKDFFGGISGDVEAKVKVIHEDGTRSLLNQYIIFSKIATEQVRLHGRTRKAVDEIYRICGERDILTNFLTNHRKEVIDLVTQIFDQKVAVEQYGRSERREGREEVQKQTIINMLLRGLGSEQDIAEVTNSTVEHVLAIKAELEASGQLPANP